MGEEQRARIAVDQSRSDALTGIIGARRACTVSMISPLSMPCRYTEVICSTRTRKYADLSSLA